MTIWCSHFFHGVPEICLFIWFGIPYESILSIIYLIKKMLQINYGNKYLAITWFNKPFFFFFFWESLGLTSQMYCSSDTAQILINYSRIFFELSSWYSLWWIINRRIFNNELLIEVFESRFFAPGLCARLTEAIICFWVYLHKVCWVIVP